jgi:hypothetical protein
MKLLNRNVTDHSLPIFDPSLTPQNAGKKGYEYIDDVIYDQLDPSDAMIDVLEFIQLFHCKLGTPVETSIPFSYFGFYIPISTKRTDRKAKKI